MPVVALQGPVQHHQAARQPAVGEGALQPEGVGRAAEGFGQPGGRGAPVVSSGSGRSRAFVQLAHPHPCGGLDRLLPEEGIRRQGPTFGGTGFPPGLLGLPAESERCSGQGEQITPVAAVNDDGRQDPAEAPPLLHAHGGDAIAAALHLPQAAAGPPFQPRFGGQPAAQDPLRTGGPVAETADPVLIQSLRLAPLQGPQQRAPESGLPGAQFIAVGSADPGGTHHSPQPGAGGEQQGVGAGPGCLKGSGDATAAASPHQHRCAVIGARGHRGKGAVVGASIPSRSGERGRLG